MASDSKDLIQIFRRVDQLIPCRVNLLFTYTRNIFITFVTNRYSHSLEYEKNPALFTGFFNVHVGWPWRATFDSILLSSRFLFI